MRVSLFLFCVASFKDSVRVCVCFQENICTDSNTHSFSSSSVMTYSKVGNEPPKVFQASSSTRCAPGGVGSPTPCVTRAGWWTELYPEFKETKTRLVVWDLQFWKLYLYLFKKKKQYWYIDRKIGNTCVPICSKSECFVLPSVLYPWL